MSMTVKMNDGEKTIYNKGDTIMIKLGDYVREAGRYDVHGGYGYTIQPSGGAKRGKPLCIISQQEIETLIEMGAFVMREFHVNKEGIIDDQM